MNKKCDIEEQVLLTRRPKPMLVVITIFGKEELRSRAHADGVCLVGSW